MRRRHPLPSRWLMTDERMGDGLWRALERLPRGGGIVFRHYRTGAGERRATYERVRAIARRRGLVLVLAGPAKVAIAWRADGVHGRSRAIHGGRRLLRTAPAHDVAEMRGVRADLLFVSPVFPTRSHPGAAALGVVRFRLLARRAGVPVIALGGMDERRAIRTGSHGWAAIDGWMR